jgi:hypothetical protein
MESFGKGKDWESDELKRIWPEKGSLLLHSATIPIWVVLANYPLLSLFFILVGHNDLKYKKASPAVSVT